MPDLPADWSTLCALVFLLGMRHGFDADHLATIDGLTRLGQARGLAHARWCGALFSLGHGVVVLGVAAAVGGIGERWDAPAWLETTGAWTSIAFLLLIGLANLRAVLHAAPGSVVGPVGVKGALFERLLGRLVQARSPLGVAAVGALFAVSFDTVSQSALFAMTAGRYGGLGHALVLGALFVAGMLATDALNGWWISRLIARADRLAARASRIMGGAVAATSLLIAALGAARLLSPAVDGWSEQAGWAVGAAVVASSALAYAAARRSAASTARAPA